MAWTEDDGLLVDAGTDYLMRQISSIGGGTTEMARNVISERVLGMPRERTADRYADLLADPDVDEKFEKLNATAANIAGINRWLDSLEQEGRPDGPTGGTAQAESS